MTRIYVSRHDVSVNTIKISDKSKIHYINDVLRLKAGDNIAVFDDGGSQYSCLIESTSEDIILRIKSRQAAMIKKNKVSVIAACAIPKNSRFDDIVDKLTQLGVDRIIPLVTERVIVKLDKERMAARRLRWEKIAIAASQQSQRSTVPVIDTVKNIYDLLRASRAFDLKLIPTLEGDRKTLREVLSGTRHRNVLFLIGPEGDFSDREIKSAIDAGCVPVSLGDQVLRVETAAVAVAGFIRLYIG